MADRYWKVGHSMGYVGTDSYETIDILVFFGWDQDKLDGYTNEQLEEMLSKNEWEQAVEKVDAWAEPISKDEME